MRPAAIVGVLLVWGCGGTEAVPAEVRVLATEPEDRVVDSSTAEIGLLFTGTRDGTVAAALGDPDSTGALTQPATYAAGTLGWISVGREALPAGGHWIAVALTFDEGETVLDEVAFTVDTVGDDPEMPACLGPCTSADDCGSCMVPSECMDFDGQRRCIPIIE